MSKHKTTKIEAGEYKYRGWFIRKSPSVSPGYYGAWRALFGPWGYSLKDVKQQIDNQIEREKREGREHKGDIA